MIAGTIIGAFFGFLAFLLVRAMIGEFLHLLPTCIVMMMFFAVIGGGVGIVGGIILQMIVEGADRD